MKIKSKVNNRLGISLIILVVTILVVAIIAAAVVINLSNANIMGQTSKTVFKQDMENYKEAYELYATDRLATNASFDRSTLNVTNADNPTEFKEIFGDKVPDKYKDGLKVVNGKLVYETEDETEKAVLEELIIASSVAGTTPSTPTNVIGTETENVNINGTEIERSKYIGYYADVDGDGIVDGVIFADLAHTVTGKQWSDSDGAFEYTAATGLKNYEVSEESYFVTGYGSKPVLKATGSGVDRFYVMSLSNFETSDYTNFYWYNTLNGSEDTLRTADDFGSGKQNTVNMISYWTADTNSSKRALDMWGVIQEKVYGPNYSKENKTADDIVWFVPSKAEWGAFGYEFGLTSSNYVSYGMSDYYWSSSSYNSSRAYYTNFLNCYIYNSGSDYLYCVRLATTF